MAKKANNGINKDAKNNLKVKTTLLKIDGVNVRINSSFISNDRTKLNDLLFNVLSLKMKEKTA